MISTQPFQCFTEHSNRYFINPKNNAKLFDKQYEERKKHVLDTYLKSHNFISPLYPMDINTSAYIMKMIVFNIRNNIGCNYYPDNCSSTTAARYLHEFVALLVLYVWQGYVDTYSKSFSDFKYFVLRCIDGMHIDIVSILIALKYIARLSRACSGYFKGYRSEVNVLIIGLMVATKYSNDISYNNKCWSDLTGIELQYLNKMELEFLRLLNFQLLINEREYLQWLNELDYCILRLLKYDSSLGKNIFVI